MSAPEVNIPLLRKAVEWAEAEAAKPLELCEWDQGWWVTPTQQQASRSPECGTCYCIAGYVAQATMRPGESFSEDGGSIVSESSDWICTVAARAREELGEDETDNGYLFASGNTIEDVRRIAEEIAGERL